MSSHGTMVTTDFKEKPISSNWVSQKPYHLCHTILIYWLKRYSEISISVAPIDRYSLKKLIFKIPVGCTVISDARASESCINSRHILTVFYILDNWLTILSKYVNIP